MKKIILILFGIVALIGVAGCNTIDSGSGEGGVGLDAGDSNGQKIDDGGAVLGWKDTQLTDVRTGQTFTVAQFTGKPILLESFAVWCPTCLQQQGEVKVLEEQEGDSIIHISIDTDPNEDEDRVSEHIQQYGFNWWFAVSPSSMTQSLIDEFGISVVNAPGAPVVAICPDQSAHLLRRGVKSAGEMKEEITKRCNG
ncbi:hypothetical protein CL622_00860 [archaeon]|nr:hypothetical protein [archaeon]|tara:strand:- start:570 stop:1157 length:588 start_codon:yes stop_codon:yes gene_type:complete